MEGWDGGYHHTDSGSTEDTRETTVPSTKSEIPSRSVAAEEYGVLLTPPFLWRAISWIIAALTIGFLVFAVQSLTDTQVAFGAFITIILGLAAGELLPILKTKIEKGFGS
jgi:hypothetical protein